MKVIAAWKANANQSNTPTIPTCHCVGIGEERKTASSANRPKYGFLQFWSQRTWWNMKRAAAFCESQRLSANAWGFFSAWVSCNQYYFKKTTIAHSPDLIVPLHLGMPKNRWCSTFVYFKTPLATEDSGGFTCSASARRCSVVKCSRGLTATSHRQLNRKHLKSSDQTLA